MESPEYPRIPEGELPRLTFIQHVKVAVEGSPVLSIIFCLWFVGVLATLVLPHLEGTPRFVALAISFVVFLASGVTFFRLLKNGYLEKPRYNTERYFLRRMGVAKPMKFLKEHPLHLAAYVELTKDLEECSNAVRTRDGLRILFLPAMLVFTGPDRYTSGPLILSIIEERGVNTVEGIAGLLDAVEHNPPVLNEGAL